MSTQQQTKTSIPTELKELPIFQFVSDQIPEQLKTPESKKTLSKILVWGLGLGLLGWIITSLPQLITTVDNLSLLTEKLAWLGVKGILTLGIGIIAITFLALSPKLVNLFTRIGSIKIFQAEKREIEKNPIDSLQMLANDVDKAVSEVDDKINEADGVRNDFITDSANLDKEAQKKFTSVKGLYDDAQKLKKEAEELKGKGMNEKAREKERDANEYLNTAMMRKQEAEADKETAAMYAQYANQFGKAIEILKDNRSAARMYLSAVKTSIRIIDRKLTATTKMKNASEGIAAAFNIKDGWVFQVAMQSAQSAISLNIATIRNNLKQLSQNSVLVKGTASANRAELDDFIKQMEQGKIQKLNVAEIADPGHDLTPEERVDPGFNILN